MKLYRAVQNCRKFLRFPGNLTISGTGISLVTTEFRAFRNFQHCGIECTLTGVERYRAVSVLRLVRDQNLKYYPDRDHGKFMSIQVRVFQRTVHKERERI
jgi:hypothetical protein